MEELPAIPRFDHYAALLNDGRILIGGGFTGFANNNVLVPFPLNDFQIYDPRDESWISITPDENQAFFVSTARLSDDKYISVGIGENEDAELSGVAGVFDSVAESWTMLPPPAFIRGIPTVALLADGRILVTGGVDFSDPTGFSFEYLLETEIFDPQTEVWQQAAPMRSASENQIVVPLQDGRVMIVQPGISIPEIYDPAADSWTPTAPMSRIPLMPEAILLSDGRVLVTGLIPGDIENYGNSERYDEDTDTWIPIDPETGEDLEVPKFGAEIYDPANDEWTTTGVMTGIRMSNTLTLLPNGSVLAAGGTNLGLNTTPRGDVPEESELSDQFLVATEIFNPETNEWILGPDISEPRYDHTATLLPDGRIFLHGGITIRGDIQEIYPTDTSEFITVPDAPAMPTVTPTATVESATAHPQKMPTPEPTFTPTPEARSETTPHPELMDTSEVILPRFGHYAWLLSDGRVLIGGGFTSSVANDVEEFQIYDPETNSWLLITPDERQSTMTSIVKLSENRYMFIGIAASGEELAGAAEIFDTDKQSWRQLPSPSTVRPSPATVMLQDGRVLVIGGWDIRDYDGSRPPVYLKDTEIFDPDTETWQQAASMNHTASQQAVALLQDGRVMVVHSFLSSAEIYDPADDSWMLTAEIDGIPYSPRAVVLSDGRVLLTGVISDELEDSRHIERYDPDTDTWIPIDPETGEEIEAPKIVSEIYDPANDTWTATEAMDEVHTSHTITLLPDGRAIVTGGLDFKVSASLVGEEWKSTNQFLFSTEIFNPETNEWTSGPEMSGPRYGHTATLLPDGRIFIFGGFTVEDIQNGYTTHTSEFITVPD